MTPDSLLADIFRLNESQKRGLKRLRLLTMRDLLYHFPSRYITVADIKYVKDLEKGNHALLYGKLTNLKTKKAYRKKIPLAEARFSDDTGSIDVVWFHQPYIAKMVPEGALVKMEGKVSDRTKPKGRPGKGKLYITNPEFERVKTLPQKAGDSLFGKGEKQFSIPIYPETRGVTSKWIYHTVRKALASGIAENIKDPLPQDILKKYNLPSLRKALFWIHTPKSEKHILSAKKRFSFEEVFLIQLQKQKDRLLYEAQDSFRIEKNIDDIAPFIERFPFEPTGAQKRAMDEILEDFSTPHAMSRLLEGDVGSGKTAAAAATAYAVVTSKPLKPDGSGKQDHGNLQVAYMAPTEILARQHFQSFIEYFAHLPIQIGLITSSGCAKFPSKVDPESFTKISRSQLLKWVKGGEIAVLVGTHSLIQKTVEFQDLAYVIIDEQHRFGVRQRMKLQRKGGPLPHLLSMTATPIPRTLALTIYGDLDLTLLDELPKGRKPVETELVPPDKRKGVYEKVREKLSDGERAYVICPRIEEPDPDKESALILKSVNAEAARLEGKIFPNYTVEKLHGKQPAKKKEEVMKRFEKGEIDILVATSVVEVGVNVPNATTIIIEGAERFGLAQLHQLRGRVQRSSRQAHCYLFTDSKSEKTKERLNALQKAKNGFELAEEDLRLRGPGSLVGTKQWGITDIGMEALKNIRMVEAARKEARALVGKDQELQSHPALKTRLSQKKTLHFE